MPLFNKVDKAEVSNYRPFLLSSPVGKVLEGVVFENVHNYLQTNNLLYKYQSGFQLHFSLEIFIIIFVSHLIINNTRVWYCFIFQKRLIGFGIRVCYSN